MPPTIPGSEIFAYKGNPGSIIRRKAQPFVALHDVGDEQVGSVDPLSYEVIRHRLWMSTLEMGEALKRMSGSIVVTDANDFNFAIMDEVGDIAQLGPYNVGLAVALDRAAKWTLENRAENPGIEEGDMFLCNDPWVGGGMHQNDVAVFAPIFWEGRLFAWSAAVSHQLDLGGVSPGSWTPKATSVFWESLPTPPVKIVRRNRIQRDIEDVYLRRSRIPRLVALDLRAQVGALNLAEERIHTLLRKYGADTVKAVMKRMMNDTEHRVRAKLRALPDGSWHSVAYQESAREGDRGLYKIACRMTKRGDHLTFDFRGTDPQAEGIIHCTHSTLYASVLMGTLPVLCGDMPYSAGGLLRCFDIVSEEGTLNNVTFPGGVSKGSVASSWATMNAVVECLSKMVDAHPQLRKHGIAGCVGTWSLAALSGIDQYQRPFVTILMDPMAGGLGARTDCDGVDTGGSMTIVMGRMPDVEMAEFMAPFLYLWRREETDSGGPGRFRGGLGASICLIPWRTETPMSLVLSGSGKAVSMNIGLHGGYPGNSQVDVTIRESNTQDLMKRGVMPSEISQVAGSTTYEPPEKETYLGARDTYYLFWQAGAGYGDPILREPERVRLDVAEFKVSPKVAREIYGVALEGDDLWINPHETRRLREAIRERRRARAIVPPRAHDRSPAASGDGHDHGTPWNDNLAEVTRDGVRYLQCRHCGYEISRADQDYQGHLMMVEGKPEEAGPQIFAEPWRYIDAKVVFRQYCCPGCATAFISQVVPENHPIHADRADVK
jgi:N-methylhydantoinase B